MPKLISATVIAGDETQWYKIGRDGTTEIEYLSEEKILNIHKEFKPTEDSEVIKELIQVHNVPVILKYQK